MPLSRREKAALERRRQAAKNALLGRGVPKPAPRGAFSDQEITITVRGARNKTVKPIKILPKFLFSHSPYFKKLLCRRNGKVRRHEHTDLSLDGDAMEHFAVYCMRDTIDDFHVSANDSGYADVLVEMLDLYLLARKLRETALMNLAVTKASALAVKHGGFVLRSECVKTIYANFEEGHMMRSYIAHQYAWAHDSGDPTFLSRGLARLLPIDFVYDVLGAQSMKLGVNRVPHQNPNLYPQRWHVPVEIELSIDDDDESSTEDEDSVVDID